MRRLILAAALAIVLLAVSATPLVVDPVTHVNEGDVRFKVTCGYSHSLADDPIVFPRQPGASHLHDFFGNQDVDASTTTYRKLQADPDRTTCNNPQDLAGYWAPAMYLDGVKQQPTRLTVYYRRGNKEGTIATIPDGLKIVAGWRAGQPHPGAEIAGWLCSENDQRQVLPPAGDCGVSPTGVALYLKMVIKFPDCSNGALDSTDHRSHMAYSVLNPATTHNECPPSHPIQLPQITEFVNYGADHAGKTVTLASGAADTSHADFFNGWVAVELQRLVDECLNGFVRCESGT